MLDVVLLDVDLTRACVSQYECIDVAIATCMLSVLCAQPVAAPKRASRFRHRGTSRVKDVVRGFGATKQVARMTSASNFEEGGLCRCLGIVFAELNQAASLRMSICRVPGYSRIPFLRRDDSGQCRDRVAAPDRYLSTAEMNS